MSRVQNFYHGPIWNLRRPVLLSWVRTQKTQLKWSRNMDKPKDLKCLRDNNDNDDNNNIVKNNNDDNNSSTFPRCLLKEKEEDKKGFFVVLSK